ncbi:unnamed protein product, partial [Protopolystoma xenopodis]
MPLLGPPQFLLDRICDPLSNLIPLLLDTVLRLPHALLFRGCISSQPQLLQKSLSPNDTLEFAATKFTRRAASAESGSFGRLPADIESRWCTTVYNLLELMAPIPISTSPPLSSIRIAGSTGTNLENNFRRTCIEISPSISGLMSSMKKLLTSIVGETHFYQLRDIHRLARTMQRIRSVCQSAEMSHIHNAISNRALDCFSFSSSTISESSSSDEDDLQLVDQTLLRVIDKAEYLDSNSLSSSAEKQLTESHSELMQKWLSGLPCCFRDVSPLRLRLPYLTRRDLLSWLWSAHLIIAGPRKPTASAHLPGRALITSCRGIAHWQRLCLRCPDNLAFLLHSSLILEPNLAIHMLQLVHLAVNSTPGIISDIIK